jgi:uncharacterized repeat protein (TIGR01451 family)
VTWNIGALANGASATLNITVTLRAQALALTAVTTTANVTGNEFDPDTANNNDSESTAVLATDLKITKTAAPPSIGLTGSVTWTVTVTNNGPNTAHNVVVIDAYVTPYTNIGSITPSAGSIIATPPAWLTAFAAEIGLPIATPPANFSLVFWNIGDLASGASASVSMTINASANFVLPPPPFPLPLLALAGPQTLPSYILPNAAIVLSTLGDSDFGNNSAYVTTPAAPTFPHSDLAVVSMTHSPEPVNPGDTVTYNIEIKNIGPDNATGVFLLDVFSNAQLTYQSATTAKGTAGTTLPAWLSALISSDPNLGYVYWDAGNLANGETATLTLIATANAALTPSSIILNGAAVSGPVIDPDTSNNYKIDTTSIGSADLAITKTDSPDPITTGGNLTYTLTVTNNGPAGATGVSVSDPLPAGVTYVSDTPSTGTSSIAAGTVTWNISSLASGASATLSIVVQVNAPIGIITNIATVRGNELDLLPLNNIGFTATLVLPAGFAPDIDVVPTAVNFGAVVVATTSTVQSVTVSNTGTISLTIISVASNDAQFAIVSGITPGDAIAPGASRTITLTFTPASEGLKTANLTITSNDPDENPFNVALSGTGANPAPPPGPPPGPPEPTPTPPPEPPPAEINYFTVDFLGLITKVQATDDGRPSVNVAAPSPDGKHLLEIEALTGATALDETVTLIEIREAQAPALPEGTQLVGKAYEFRPTGTVFDKPVKLTLGYNISDLPENVKSVGLAFYSPGEGWTYLEAESSNVAELGKLTAPVNHFTVFAVLAQVTPPKEPEPTPTPTPTPQPLPASFNLSNLSITTSEYHFFPGLHYFVRTGKDAVITVDVHNTGEQAGIYTVILKLNGEERESKDITLQPGKSGTVTFDTKGNEPGDYTVVVGSLNGEFESKLWINWWLIVGTIALIILIRYIIWYIMQRRKRKQTPETPA